MAREYQITAEVKKGDQEWTSVLSNRDSRMTAESLAKSYGALRRMVIRGHFDDIYIKL